MMTGSGGWPLSVFLTPEGKPFYGGTYFPPRAGFGRPSFRQVLAGRRAGLADAASRPADVVAVAHGGIGPALTAGPERTAVCGAC